ncbi:histidine phosphatase family protein [Paenibacillus sp. GCM10023250]|uniref:histidine phosphatase family protein n=1 Tax=Paenibacillus sp. GCM10023250 TaxID=3252648 RepID=UPI003616F3C1
MGNFGIVGVRAAKRLAALMLAAAVAIAFVAGVPDGAHAAQRPQDLAESLREGGFVLYVRHGEANVGEDRPDADFADCGSQRNLSEAGRRQAASFGQALRELRIPVRTPVEASPFCRTRETAALAFGRGNVDIQPFWASVSRLSGPISEAERTETLEAVSARLEVPPLPGTNRVVVAHGFPAGAGLGPIPDMGAVVVKPNGRGRAYEIVGRLSVEELLQLAKRSPPVLYPKRS